MNNHVAAHMLSRPTEHLSKTLSKMAAKAWHPAKVKRMKALLIIGVLLALAVLVAVLIVVMVLRRPAESPDLGAQTSGPVARLLVRRGLHPEWEYFLFEGRNIIGRAEEE